MRIVHLASVFTPDNRFGGPTKVALELAQQLRARGHEVTVVGAAVGWDRVPAEIDGVPVRLVRGHLPPGPLGWAALVAPGLRRAVREEIRQADVLHVHLARDLVTLGGALVARRAHVPYLVQTHGMIDRPSGVAGRAVDRLATARVVSSATAALTLTEDEQHEVGRLSTRPLPAPLFRNGVALPPGPPVPQARPEVLFLARLHPRKGAVAFVRAALAVRRLHPAARFAVVGPDEGDLHRVTRLIADAGSTAVRVAGAVPSGEARRLLAGARAYVLPAENEPFGLTLIEAMSVGRPVVLHASSTLARTVVDAGAGWSFGPGGTFETLEQALELVVTDDRAVEQAGVRALALVTASFSLDSVVDDLLGWYRAAITPSPGGGGRRE